MYAINMRDIIVNFIFHFNQKKELHIQRHFRVLENIYVEMAQQPYLK